MKYAKFGTTYIPIQMEVPVRIYDIGDGKYKLVFKEGTLELSKIVEEKDLEIVDGTENI